MLQFFNGVPFCRGKCEDLHFGNRLNLLLYIFGTDTRYIDTDLSSNLAIRSVHNAVVELSRRYSVVMKVSDQCMHKTSLLQRW